MTPPLRALVVEDSPSDAKLVVEALRGTGRAVEFERVQTAASMRAALEGGAWDVVTSDWSMPGFSARAALDVLKQSGRDLPFIIVSGTIGEEAAVSAMRAGAHDFLLKDQLARLAPAVERELRECADRAARSREQARFRALIDRSEEGVSLTARDGTSLYMSPAAERILGYTAAESAGRGQFDTAHPDDRALVGAALARLLERPGASDTVEFRVVRPDGSCRWIAATATNRLDEPAVGAIVANFRDVTDWREALDALRASEARYRSIVETTNEGVWVVDADAKTTFMNARMAGMLGCDPEGVKGRTLLDFLSEDARPIIHGVFPRLQAGASDQVEVPFTRADGATVWTLLEASPIVDGAGRFEGALAMVMDVSARRRAEQELRASEGRYRAVVENIPDVIWTRDTAGRLHYVSPNAEQLLGFSQAEFLREGTALTMSRVHPEDVPALAAAAEALLGAGVPMDLDYRFRHRDGRWIVVRDRASNVREVDGVRYIDGISTDVTDRRGLEAQLRQAQKMEAVGRLAGGVAHDFNNVLSVILGFSQLALSDLAPGEPLRDDLEEICTAAQRAADLTRQLLMFSRQQVIEPKVLDLGEVLASMTKMVRQLVGEDVELVTSGVLALGRVRADPSSVEQVVMNLVVNARDAMPTGGTLTIGTEDVALAEEYARTHHGVRPGRYVMLAVGDTGTGMDEATQARIFEPFFTTKEQGKGTGLGLSTVFGIVQQSNGSISVDSEPGRGTTFRVYLPRVDAEVEAPRSIVPPASRRGTETVLLVEDEDQVRAIARTILRRYGYAVVEASSAGEALLHSEQHDGPIHLLLTDVVMPHMSGPELAHRLAQTRPAMRVLCMSGYTDDSVVRHGVMAASLAYIQKPLTPDSLAQKVREVLDAPPLAAP